MRAFLFSICLLFIPIAAHAHSGMLNKEGCHNNRQTGDYHCHRGAKAEPKKSNKPTLSGVPRIIDGDTIRIGNTRIRLHGIDAPEARQTCTIADGTEWRCGQEATNGIGQCSTRQHRYLCCYYDYRCHRFACNWR
jgi:endonuclease YncB( thermonuclease family)